MFITTEHHDLMLSDVAEYLNKNDTDKRTLNVMQDICDEPSIGWTFSDVGLSIRRHLALFHKLHYSPHIGPSLPVPVFTYI